MSKLGVKIDGVPLGDDEARAFWKRFSEWMDEHEGDLGGFAASERLASVQPELHDGMPVLVGSRSAPQGEYAKARKRVAKPKRRSG